MKRSAISTIVSLLSLIVLGSFSSSAQNVPALDKIQYQEELVRAVAALDAAVFDSYNKCDLDKFASFFVDDVEFYHDQGGVTPGKVALTDSVKKNICGKVTRELVPGSLKVFHMKGYGRSRRACTGFTIRDMMTPKGWARGSSSICGSTKTGHGKSRA